MREIYYVLFQMMKIKNIKVYSPQGGELAPTTEKSAFKMVARNKAKWIIKDKSIKLRYSRHAYDKRRNDIIEQSGRVCYICKRVIPDCEKATIDHIIPKVKYGTDNFDNLRCCCKRCNDDKGSMDINEYIRHIKNNIKSYTYIDILALEKEFARWRNFYENNKSRKSI